MSELSIVIPCYNPPEGWEKNLVDQAQGFQNYLGREFQLILINDASSKGIEPDSIDYIQKQFPKFRYLSYETNHGKGYALRYGVKELDKGLIIYTDIDFPYTFGSMKAILESLESGKDVAVGTRDNIYYESTPARRTLISKFLRWTFRVVFRLPITDTQCGLKGFNQAGKEVFLQTRIERFLFDMEFIALSSRTKSIDMEAVTVKLRSNIQFSKMSMKILLTESVNFFRIFWLTHFK